MIRFLMARKERQISGGERIIYYTIDGDIAELEQALTSGGFSEDCYEIHDLIGAEVIDIDE